MKTVDPPIVPDSVPSASRQIHNLADEVVDQIAAGEVVERPAHLIKELIENSLDAGATEIEVEFHSGGRWVRVRDNGSGIPSTELSLALSRHATSKIAQTADLWNLSSYGFRGEALASIGAVSRLTLTSRQPKQAMASQIRSDFGRCHEVIEVGGEVGTSVLIQDLFENMPARLKFLKSDVAETTQIKLMLKAVALANPSVSFRVNSKGRLLHYWEACDTALSRSKLVLESDELFYVNGEENGIQVEAVFSPPHRTHGSRRQLWTFVQGRWVTDSGLQKAILEAYRNLLMHGEFPMVALWVRLSAQDVDVNIHPTKSQIKFRDPRASFRAVYHTLRRALENAPWLETLLQNSPKTAASYSRPRLSKDVLRSFQPSFVEKGFSEGNLQDHELTKTSFQTKASLGPSIQNGTDEKKDSSKAKRESSFTTFPENTKPSVSHEEKEDGGEQGATGVSTQTRAPCWQDLQLLGQADLTYLVCQSRKSLVFIDQHAAHERVAFERLMKAWSKGGSECQRLLIPLTLDFGELEVEKLFEEQARLQTIGFELERSGPGVVELVGRPAFLSDKATAEGLKKLATELVQSDDSFALEKIIGDVFATMACHSVIRAGQVMSHEEMTNLLVQMDEFRFSSFCPHGRPVFVEYPFVKLERDFGRIV